VWLGSCEFHYPLSHSAFSSLLFFPPIVCAESYFVFKEGYTNINTLRHQLVFLPPLTFTVSPCSFPHLCFASFLLSLSNHFFSICASFFLFIAFHLYQSCYIYIYCFSMLNIIITVLLTFDSLD